MKIKNNALLIFLLLIPIIGITNQESKAAEQSLPSADALILKHVEALGGEDVIRAHTSRTIEGKFLLPQFSVEGDLSVSAAAPQQIISKVVINGMGASGSGYNGNIAWNIDPMQGSSILEGELMEAAAIAADFYSDLHLGALSTMKKTLEIAMIDGNEAYRVLLEDKNAEQSFMFFSVSTGLLVGIDSMAPSAAGKVPTSTRFSEYKEFDGVTSATLIKTSQAGVESIIQIDSVTYDDVGDDAFILPTSISALIK